MSQAEWKRSPSGSLRTEKILPSGMKLNIRFVLASGQKITIETWPDAQRVTYDYGPPAIEPIEQLQNMIKSITRPEVSFLDGNKNSLIGIRFESASKVSVNLTTVKSDEEVRRVDEDKTLVKIQYQNSKIVSCDLQAETLTEQEQDIPEDATWKDLFLTFLNLRRTASPEDLSTGKSANIDYFKYYVEKNFINNNPNIQQSLTVASELINFMLSSVPTDDKDEALRLIKDYGWDYSLALYLLTDCKERNLVSIKDVLRDLGKDEWLDGVMRTEISFDSELDLPEFKNILRLTTFFESGFQWQELEVEEVDMEQKEIKRNEGSNEFGSEVSIQDHILRIEKDAGKILITCLTNRGKLRWTASFPTELPVDEITQVGNDPNADFREIKPLIDGVWLTARR